MYNKIPMIRLDYRDNMGYGGDVMPIIIRLYIPNISQPTIPKYIHNNLPSGYCT